MYKLHVKQSKYNDHVKQGKYNKKLPNMLLGWTKFQKKQFLGDSKLQKTYRIKKGKGKSDISAK